MARQEEVRPTITYICPHCQHTLQIPEQYAGTHGTCNHCRKAITVPDLSDTSYQSDPPDPLGLAPTFASAGPPILLSPSDEDDDTPAAPRRNWPFTLENLGKSMTACGCLIFVLPVFLFVAGCSIYALFSIGTSPTPSTHSARSTSSTASTRPSPTSSRPTSTTPVRPMPSSLSTFIDPFELQIGATYRLEKETPICPAPDSGGSYDEATKRISQIVRVRAGTAVHVLSSTERNGHPWYQVTVPGTDLSGWINCSALLGQNLSLCP